MSSTIKNVILFLGIGIALVVLYVVFFKGGQKEEDFTTTVDLGSGQTTTFPETLPEEKAEIARAFLSDLLSIRNIGLDADVFSEITFSSLRDAGVVLIQDGKEGRPNPFAPIGQDILVPENVIPTSTTTTPTTSTSSTTTPTTNSGTSSTPSTTGTTPKTGGSTN